MADFDPLTVPAVMPQKVARVTTAGLPTQPLLDYEQALQSWMKSNVTNTNTRINLVSEEIDGAYAAVETEATARASADEAIASQITTVTARVEDAEASIVAETTARTTADTALASDITSLTSTVSGVSAAVTTEASTRASADTALAASITTVEAIANNGTASGSVYLAARTAPSGATAAYGWHLTAGSSYAGMEAIALSAGGSAIGFTADKFYFTDSGTAQQVLSYSSGSFIFQVPIVIQSGTSGARTVVTSENIKVYDSAGNLRVAIGVNI